VNFAQNWLRNIFPKLIYSNAKLHKKNVSPYFIFLNQKPRKSIFNFYFYKTYQKPHTSNSLLSESEQMSLDLQKPFGSLDLQSVSWFVLLTNFDHLKPRDFTCFFISVSLQISIIQQLQTSYVTFRIFYLFFHYFFNGHGLTWFYFA